jgi:hypothetical protein
VSIEASIRAALSERLDGLDTDLPILWENRKNLPTAGNWMLAQLIRNRTARLGIAPMHRWPGILQVSVMTGLGEGPMAGDRIAEQVAAHFPADLRLVHGTTTVRVTEAPSVAGGLVSGGWWEVPVSIYFEALQ